MTVKRNEFDERGLGSFDLEHIELGMKRLTGGVITAITWSRSGKTCKITDSRMGAETLPAKAAILIEQM